MNRLPIISKISTDKCDIIARLYETDGEQPLPYYIESTYPISINRILRNTHGKRERLSDEFWSALSTVFDDNETNTTISNSVEKKFIRSINYLSKETEDVGNLEKELNISPEDRKQNKLNISPFTTDSYLPDDGRKLSLYYNTYQSFNTYSLWVEYYNGDGKRKIPLVYYSPTVPIIISENEGFGETSEITETIREGIRSRDPNYGKSTIEYNIIKLVIDANLTKQDKKLITKATS